jgi:hypothetical protein
MAEKREGKLTLETRIDFKGIEKLLKDIKSQTLAGPLAAFYDNMENVDGLLSIPWFFVAPAKATPIVMSSILRSFESVIVSGEREGLSGLDLFQKGVAQMQEDFKEMKNWKDDPKIKDLAKQMMTRLVEQLLDDPGNLQSLIILVKASTTSLWTAYECLMRDMWISMLNSHPALFVGKAIEHVGQTKGLGDIREKRIRVETIAECEYDLRNCMGTLLAKNYELSNVSTIKKAYVTVLPGQRITIGAEQDLDGLHFLEAARHVIVHKAGKVDKRFHERLEKKYDMSKYPEGKALVIDFDQVCDLAQMVLDSSCRVISAIDDFMEASIA